MNHIFDDEREFRDALSGYILTRRRPRANPTLHWTGPAERSS